MKNVLYVVIGAMLIAATCGCNSCGSSRGSMFSWFNRGDSCRTCTGGEVYSDGAGLGSPILNNVPAAPRSGILPAPVGITPYVDGQ